MPVEVLTSPPPAAVGAPLPGRGSPAVRRGPAHTAMSPERTRTGMTAFDETCSRLIRKFPGQHICVREFGGVLNGRAARDEGGERSERSSSRPATPPVAVAPPTLASALPLQRAFTDVPPATTAALRSTRATNTRCRVAIDTSGSRYNVVRVAAARLGYDEAGPEVRPHVVWVDTSISENRLMKLPDGSHINHFPGMLNLCRKIDSARLLSRMQREHPRSYAFVPPTYLSYDDFLRAKARQARGGVGGGEATGTVKWYIVKPDAGCMGKGIHLTPTPKKEMFEKAVVQEYVTNPLLIDRCKWDMRVYVLVLSVDPLRIYVYRDGFIRLCTEKYQTPLPSNADNTLIHLTNYAIHKNSRKYKQNVETSQGEKGCKRSFAFLTDHLKRLGHDTDAFWNRVSQMCVKSLLAVEDTLRFSYRNAFPEPGNLGTSCFEILGFDVLVDQNLDPWLLEVNHAPSFSCDTDLDYSIKSALIQETMQLVGAEFELSERHQHPPPRSADLRREFAARFRVRKDAYEARTAERFVRVYPSADPETAREYDALLASLTRRTLPPQGLLYAARQQHPPHAATATHALPLPPRSTGGYTATMRAPMLRNSTASREAREREDALRLSKTPMVRVAKATRRTLTTPPAFSSPTSRRY